MGYFSLASTHLGTPDPRQLDPPLGTKILISWAVPTELLEQNPKILLHIIYKNYSEERFSYLIDAPKGSKIYSLLGDDYLQKGDILTYRAAIVREDGSICREWLHQLWVNLVRVDR